MHAAISDLLGSKRFLVTLLATGIITYLCARGKITPDQMSGLIAKLAMVLTAAYGIENAAAMYGASFPDPSTSDPGPSVSVNTSQSTAITPKETPMAKAAAAKENTLL